MKRIFKRENIDEKILDKLRNYLNDKVNLSEKKILFYLDQLIQLEVDKEYNEIFIELLKKSNSILIINKIALIMEEYPHIRYADFLFETYLRLEKGERGTVLFAMTAYDYGDKIKTMIDSFFKDGISDEESMSISDVILQMKSLDLEEVNSLLDYYENINFTDVQNQLVLNTVYNALIDLQDDINENGNL